MEPSPEAEGRMTGPWSTVDGGRGEQVDSALAEWNEGIEEDPGTEG